MSQERRQHERFVIELAVEISFGDQRFTATTKDISVTGCCIVGPYPLKEESTIMCSLYVVLDGIEEADLSSLETMAVVQWAADTEDTGSDVRYMTGLRFQGLAPLQEDWLKGIIGKVEASAP
jgi:c-di-GMP-binding flagellar brake protein YcgR